MSEKNRSKSFTSNTNRCSNRQKSLFIQSQKPINISIDIKEFPNNKALLKSSYLNNNFKQTNNRTKTPTKSIEYQVPVNKKKSCKLLTRASEIIKNLKLDDKIFSKSSAKITTYQEKLNLTNNNNYQSPKINQKISNFFPKDYLSFKIISKKTYTKSNKINRYNLNLLKNNFKINEFNLNFNTTANNANDFHLKKNIFLNKYNNILKDYEKEELSALKEDEIYFYKIKSYNYENNNNSSLNKVHLNYTSKNICKNYVKNKNKSINISGGHSLLLNNNNYFHLKNLNCFKNSANNFNNSLSTEVNNNLFDDNNGYFKVKVGEHINYRYEILSLIEKSTFSETLKCKDHKLNKIVCIKMLISSKKRNQKNYNSFSNEIKILSLLRTNECYNESNIYKLLSKFEFRNHICLVFEYLGINLYKFLSERKFAGISLEKIRKVAIKLLFSLLLLKQYNIIHCDLKPENILFSDIKNFEIKLIDFGISCFENNLIYQYIQSRYYRAPEIALELQYTKAIDIWSLGCILCELYQGHPIFEAESNIDLIYCISEYLNLPPKNLVDLSPKKDEFFDEDYLPYDISNSDGIIRTPNSKNLNIFLKGADQNFINFIKCCLQWDYSNRISPDKALMHPWIIKGMSENELILHKKKIKKFNNSLLNNCNDNNPNNKGNHIKMNNMTKRICKTNQNTIIPKRSYTFKIFYHKGIFKPIKKESCKI